MAIASADRTVKFVYAFESSVCILWAIGSTLGTLEMAMKSITRNELALMLVWAFREQRVESAATPHVDALTLYCNVMALPVSEAATVVTHARSGDIPPSDPVALARWTKGLTLLRDMLEQPLCTLTALNAIDGSGSGSRAA